MLRYTARGDFVDQFVPTDPDRLIVGCCMTYGPDDNLYVVSPFFDTVLRYNGAIRATINGSGG